MRYFKDDKCFIRSPDEEADRWAGLTEITEEEWKAAVEPPLPPKTKEQRIVENIGKILLEASAEVTSAGFLAKFKELIDGA